MHDPLAYIQSLSEADLRSQVLVPLFTKMGFNDVVEHHGALEFGKDIVFRELDRFGEYIYYGVAAKRGDIHGSVGKSGNVSEVFYQAQQAFGEPWVDPFDARPHMIDRVIITTSGKITQVAILSISERMRGQNIRFVDGRKIVNLINQYSPDILSQTISEASPTELWELVKTEANPKHVGVKSLLDA